MVSYRYVGNGVNKYVYLPESSLNQCVSDVRNVASALKTLNFECETYADAQCTKEQILKHWWDAIERGANSKNAFVVLHQSSHGSQQKSDDPEEDDGLDEVFMTYDVSWNNNTNLWNNGILDNEVADMFAKIPDNVLVLLIADTCHSGTMTRGIRPVEMVRNRKFIYPRDWVVRNKKPAGDVADYASGFVDTPNNNFILLAGASPSTFSFEDGNGGVLSTSLANCIRATTPAVPTRTDLIANIIKYVKAGGFSQYPHYSCPAAMMPKGEFAYDTERTVVSVSPQKKTNWLIGIWKWLTSLLG